MAVAVEGPSGGLFGRNKVYGLSGDVYLFLFVIPLFLLISLIVRGFDSLLIGTLTAGAFVGGILQDFFWFVINPNFGIWKFNSEYATWLTWSNFGFFEIPTFYAIYGILAVVMWFAFIKNSKRVDSFYKHTIKKKPK
jgi:hypothetical protein